MLAISILRCPRRRTRASSKSFKSKIKTLRLFLRPLRVTASPCRFNASTLQRFNADNVAIILCQWVPCQKSLSQRPQTKNSSSQR